MIKIDAEDQWLLDAYDWSIQKTAPQYAFRQFVVDGKRIREYLHRRIMRAGTGQFIDHVNGDGLDCRKGNLRICTHAENMRNRKVSKNNKLGIKGVSARGKLFVAEIAAFGVRYKLGSFKTAIAAQDAYLAAAKKLHGEFAKLVF